MLANKQFLEGYLFEQVPHIEISHN